MNLVRHPLEKIETGLSVAGPENLTSGLCEIRAVLRPGSMIALLPPSLTSRPEVGPSPIGSHSPES